MKKAIVSILVILVAVKCVKKKNEDAPQNPGVQPSKTLSFSSAGKTGTHSKLKFTSNADPGSTVLWKFGDGDSSTEMEPYHTYSVAGNYAVSLTAGKQTSNQNLTISSTAAEMEGTYTNIGEVMKTVSNYTTVNHATLLYSTTSISAKFVVHNITDSTVEVIDTFFNYSFDKYKLKLNTAYFTDSTIVFSSGKTVFLNYNFLNNHLYFDIIVTGTVAGSCIFESYKLK